MIPGTPRGTCSHHELRTKRSCIGCGLRPGTLHANGLCRECQHPELADKRAELWTQP